jgi:hypothetical protein
MRFTLVDKRKKTKTDDYTVAVLRVPLTAEPISSAVDVSDHLNEHIKNKSRWGSTAWK